MRSRRDGEKPGHRHERLTALRPKAKHCGLATAALRRAYSTSGRHVEPTAIRHEPDGHGQMHSQQSEELDPRQAFGTAGPDRPPARSRPDGMTDAEVQALGTLSEALEVVEYIRGLLYEFHRRSGTADKTLQQASAELRSAGHPELAAELDDVLVGRDVLPGLWTFQIVEAYDEQYWSVFRAMEQRVRDRLGADRHLYEAEMKHREQS
jgi:hypothetical protein